MADVPTQLDLFLVGRSEAILSPTRFDRAIIDTVGSDVNTVFNVSATMGEEVGRYIQVSVNELALGTAEREALDRFVFDRYQIVRQRASNAVVTLSLTRTGNTGLTVPAGSVFGTSTGINFRTANDVAFAANVLGPLEVLATAVQTGTSGNVSDGEVSVVVSAQADSTLAVTNPEAAAGGSVGETDEQLQARAREFFVTARRGTRAAIEFGALEVAGIEQASAIETFTSFDQDSIPGYRVLLSVSDANGQANTALASAVNESLDEYRGLGVPVLVVPAVPQFVDIVATGLQFSAGANTTQVLQNAANAILAAVNGTAPGQILYRASIVKALEDTTQLVVPDGALVEPAGDLVPSTGTVIRTTRDRITLSG